MGARRTAEILTAIPLNKITPPQLEHAERAAADRPVIKGRDLALEVTLAEMMSEISRRNRGRGRGRIR